MFKTLSTSISSITLILAGCTVGPDYTRPEVATPANYTQPTPEAAINVAHWTELYADAQLTELVQQARAQPQLKCALSAHTSITRIDRTRGICPPPTGRRQQ